MCFYVFLYLPSMKSYINKVTHRIVNIFIFKYRDIEIGCDKTNVLYTKKYLIFK